MDRITLSLFCRILELTWGEKHKCTTPKPYGSDVAGKWAQRRAPEQLVTIG